MNTSEVLDLSKENIQPLKQGRNAVKLGTALQAQTNAELHQKMLAEREQFELLIRMYEGDDPLKPHYEYVHWIEQSFPKHGPESNLVQILENTLTTFRDDERYKQDLRYAELLIKYIDMQSNPLEIYQLVYNQGLCTMCAPFYKAWADELDKCNDFKQADQIYELGIKVKAQPLELLQDAHLQFQLSVGRRMLGRQEECVTETESNYNRQVLHKLKKSNVHGIRDPVSAPGSVKQQPIQPIDNLKNKNTVPFIPYQGDDKDYNVYNENYGKGFPKQHQINKENTLKAGQWTQNRSKQRGRVQWPTTPSAKFQVHQDEGADMCSGQHKTLTVPRALKQRKVDDFTCPLAIFEPPDPTKRPMYCKNKVYAGGREFQFEELRAAIYNSRYEQLNAMKFVQEIKSEISNMITPDKGNLEEERGIEENKHEEAKLTTNPAASLQGINNNPVVKVEAVEKLPFDGKTVPLEVNTSLFHCQSFTVNTKEAMNVVQEMWNSPAPAQVFGKKSRMSRASQDSPELNDSGVFKVPAVPPPLSKSDDEVTSIITPKPSTTNKPSFPVYSDEEPATQSAQTFQIYSDDAKSEEPQNNENKLSTNSSTNKNIVQNKNDHFAILTFDAIGQLPQYKHSKGPFGSDDVTLKMLAFQSDSDESSDDLPLIRKDAAENINNDLLLPTNVPVMRGISPRATPVEEETEKNALEIHSSPHMVLQEEDRYDDMTCNTKAFDFVLPSSTPLVGHLKSSAPSQLSKNCINGSFITEEAKKCGTKQDLSMIFEASKERYSSSSGSSGCKTQGSVCTVANTSVQPVQAELVDKLAQISANTSLDLETSFGLLNISGPVDPFSMDLINQLLTHIGYPKKHHLIGLHRFDSDAPLLHSNSTVKLGATKYSISAELGRGNYARVLKATRNGQQVALKQQRPAWEWEWYIIQELQSKLPPSMMDGYLHMSNGYIYKNASILESEWAQYGSILSVVNKLKTAGKGHDLQLAVLFSIQLMSIVEHLHKCRIIHGDIKPDNFVLCSVPTPQINKLCLKLIDFGRSIDMSLLPEGTTFNTVVTTDGFQCNEMKEGRPWTYQTDLYGLAGSVYCVLFYDYMKVVKRDKKWHLSNKIPRYMMPGVWQEVFDTLLNVESCDNLPDLTVLRGTLEQCFASIDPSSVNQSINKLSNVLQNK